MKTFQRIIGLSLSILLLSSSTAFAKLSEAEKNLAQQWKMWKVEKAGNEVTPVLSRFIITMSKKKTFVITTGYEMTHRGTWEYKNKTLKLTDKVTNKTFVLPVKELDHTHLVFSNYEYEGEGKTTFMTPINHKNALHLNHNEHLLAKKWHIYESTKEDNKDALYDFHEDKTFSYYLAGHSLPISEGKWTLSEDAKTVTLHLKRSKEDIVLEILEFHRHSLILKSPESGTINKLHDEYLTKRDEAVTTVDDHSSK